MSDLCGCGVPWVRSCGYCDGCRQPEPDPPPPTNEETIEALKMWLRGQARDVTPCARDCGDFDCMIARFVNALDTFAPEPPSDDVRRTILRMCEHIVKGNETSPVFHEIHAVRDWVNR